jgi:hypothetical protein
LKLRSGVNCSFGTGRAPNSRCCKRPLGSPSSTSRFDCRRFPVCGDPRPERRHRRRRGRGCRWDGGAGALFCAGDDVVGRRHPESRAGGACAGDRGPPGPEIQLFTRLQLLITTVAISDLVELLAL